MEDLHTKKCIDQNKNMNFKSKAHLANSRMEDEYQRIDHNLKKQELKFAVESVQSIIKDQFKQIQAKKHLNKDMQTHIFKAKNELSPKERVDKFREHEKQKYAHALQKHANFKNQTNLLVSRVIQKNEKKRQQKLLQQRKKESQIKKRVQNLTQTFHKNQKMLAQNLDNQRMEKQQQKILNQTKQLKDCQTSLSDRYIQKMNSANYRIKSMCKSQELSYMAKYIKKSQIVQGKKIMRQIQYNKRRNESITTPVRCTIHLRMQKQIAQVSKKETQLMERTQRFERSRLQLLQRSKTATQGRSFFRATQMQEVRRRKEERDQALVQKAFQQYSKRALKSQQWQNMNSKQVYNEVSDKILHQRFLIKKKIHEREQQHINKMNSIFRKTQNIKREYQGGNEEDKENKLVEYEKKSILKEIDENDQNLNEVRQFLKESKENFRNKMINQMQGKKTH